MKFLGDPRSGSYDGQTSSRNRFGQYVRTRAIPVNPNTPSQANQRARQSTNAAAWRTLTDGQRAGWLSLGLMIVRTDSLGQTYDLNGFLAFCSVNNNLADVGESTVTTAPALATPPDVATATITLTGAAFSVAYTPTPLGAGVRLLIRCSPQRSAGRKFEADYRLIAFTAAAAASPANILAAYTAKFGAPVVDNRIFVSLQTEQDGFLGSPFLVSQVVA